MDEAFLANYNNFLLENQNLSFLLLIALGYFGGLISSLSPCVLSLLPMNLAYIGTMHIDCKIEAFKKAWAFVLGVATVLTLLGVFSNFAFAVFNEYKGIIHTTVGIFVILMALMLIEVIKLPLPNFITQIPESNPYIVGLIFALVSSPCSSPVLFGVLSIAGSSGSLVKSTLMMFAYSLGYTVIIFFASLFTGLIKQLDWFKKNGDLVIKISAAILAITGAAYLYIGIKSLIS